MQYRTVTFVGRTQRTIDSWDDDVGEIIKTNLQALQGSRVSSFSDLPDWGNSGKVTDKKVKGRKLGGARQLTVKHRDSFRVVYIAEIGDRIFIIHAFKKKTEGVDKPAMNAVATRLSTLKKDLASGGI